MEKLKQMKEIVIKNKKWIILALVIFIFVAIAEDVLEQEKFTFDSYIYHFLLEHRKNYLTTFLRAITNFGGAICLIIISILCIIFIKRKKYKLTIPLNLLIISVVNFILKNIFSRPRPDEYRIIEETGFSFPSGHSMASAAFYGYLIYLIYKNVKNKKIRNILCTILSILILAIGFSRIYLGVHYTSDVVAGLCFSIAYLILMIHLEIY